MRRITKEKIQQLFRFALVGLSGVVVNLMVFSLAIANGVEYHTAAIGAFLTAVSHNFYWNARWTFRILARTYGRIIFRYLCFVLISAACLFFNLQFLSVMIEQWQISPLAAQTGAVLTVGAANFWLQSILTFKGVKTDLRTADRVVGNE